jgi:hypothetical protein
VTSINFNGLNGARPFNCPFLEVPSQKHSEFAELPPITFFQAIRLPLAEMPELHRQRRTEADRAAHQQHDAPPQSLAAAAMED